MGRQPARTRPLQYTIVALRCCFPHNGAGGKYVRDSDRRMADVAGTFGGACGADTCPALVSPCGSACPVRGILSNPFSAVHPAHYHLCAIYPARLSGYSRPGSLQTACRMGFSAAWSRTVDVCLGGLGFPARG